VASGDDGSDDQVGDGQAHINFPATSPYVLSVGGTALVKQGNGFTEKVWFDGDGLRKDGGGSTGGGVSAAFPRPAWQGSINIPSVNPNAGPGRIVPDVAANAAGSTGYFVVAQGRGEVSGGTSAATPLWAGLLARLIKANVPVGYIKLHRRPGARPLAAWAAPTLPRATTTPPPREDTRPAPDMMP
jgi:kumamolisin